MVHTSAQKRVSAFWADDHWRNGFKATSPNAHSGQDIGGHRAGMMVPAVREGVVTHNFFDAFYGWVLAVKVSSSTWHLYCHMLGKSPQQVGWSVDFGEGVGQVGASGAYAVGFHLHFTVSSSPKPAHRPTTNPRATIKAALRKATTPAGGTITPITKEYDMIHWYCADVANDVQRRGIFTGTACYSILPTESTDLRKTVPMVNVTRAELDTYISIAARSPKPGAAAITPEQITQIGAAVKVDINGVLDAIRQVPTTVVNLIKQQWAKS